MFQRGDDIQADEAETIETRTDAYANTQLAVLNPLFSVLVLVTILFGFIAVVSPGLILGAALYSALLLLLVIYIYFRAGNNNEILWRSKTEFRSALQHYLNAASLWYLAKPNMVQASLIESSNPLLDDLNKNYQQWKAAQIENTIMQLGGDLSLLVLSLMGALLLLVNIPMDLLGAPILVCLILAVLTLPDWFSPTLKAAIPAAASYQSKQWLIDKIDESINEELSQHEFPTVVRQFSLQDFCWKRAQRRGQPVSVDLNLGDILWINGGSGTGKSSLLLAINQLLDSEGDMVINSVKLNSSSYDPGNSNDRQPFIYTEQLPSILSDTLKNNLLIANPDASDQQLLDALKFACLDNLTAQGLDQWLGLHGRILSGGERKRLGVARAYLSAATVWLLDEPFEGLDQEMASRLAKHIVDTARHRICIVASHKINSAFQPTQNQAIALSKSAKTCIFLL